MAFRTGGGRKRASREARRQGQFAKFKVTELNLVPLVDTFVSVVFFALTTITVGELAPVAMGVTLPESHVGTYALQQLTLGVGRDVTVAGVVIVGTADAAALPSTLPNQPLVIPPLYAVLKVKADSIRAAFDAPPAAPLPTPLAIQGDRTMRYDLLARIMQTARVAGFVNITLQVKRASDAI
jgi:biopolymer transport protein ExbD